MEVEEEAHSSITKEAPKDAPKVEVKRWDLACSLSPMEAMKSKMKREVPLRPEKVVL